MSTTSKLFAFAAALVIVVLLLLITLKRNDASPPGKAIPANSTPSPTPAHATSAEKHATTQPTLDIPDAAVDPKYSTQNTPEEEAKYLGPSSLKGQFESKQRSPTSEARVVPILDEVFGRGTDGHKRYELECRNDICRTRSLTEEQHLWLNRLNDKGRHLWHEFLTFNDDVGTIVYMKLTTIAFSEAHRIKLLIWEMLKQSPLVAECRTTHPTPTGQASFRVKLERQGEKLKIGETEGSLAAAPSGGCLRAAVEAVVAAQVVHPETAPFEQVYPLTVP